jgi:asparagine synthetase B (glutamine-hydrolysing)
MPLSVPKAVFFEAAFLASVPGQPFSGWADRSTAKDFIFESSFGVMRLRKRSTYPQTFARINGNELHFGYGDSDRARSVLEQSLQNVPEAAFYGTEFTYAVADCALETVVVQRDALSTLPLVTAMDETRLYMANTYERVYHLFESEALQPNVPVVARMALAAYTGGRTLFEGIEVLYDRQRLQWSKQHQEIIYPPHGSIVDIAKHRQGDPKLFRQKLEQTLENYWQRYNAPDALVGSELSCGLDTSVVNGYMALKKRRLFIVSSIYDGKHRQSIQLKIRDFSERFKVPVHKQYMSADTEFPFAGMLSETGWRPFYHSEEIYRDSLGKIAELLSHHNVKTVFRGVGGDELFENIPDYSKHVGKGDLVRRLLYKPISEAPDFLTEKFKAYCERALEHDPELPRPIPLQSMTVAASSIVGNNLYIERDIWPVNPLSDPELYIYCQSLPIEYRANREIMRAYLEARKFPASIYTWENEDFADFFDRSVTKLEPHFYAALNSSVLAKTGWLDPQAAKQTWRSIIESGVTDTDAILFWLFCIMSVEINLQLAGISELRQN